MKLMIEKGIPIPPRRFGNPGLIAVLRGLEVGDSVLVPPTAVKGATTVTSMVSYARRRTGLGFLTRQVEGGVRIWRVE